MRIPKNVKLADELTIGEVVASGETILAIRDVYYDGATKIEFKLRKPNGKTRTAMWGKHSTIFMKRA